MIDWCIRAYYFILHAWNNLKNYKLDVRYGEATSYKCSKPGYSVESRAIRHSAFRRLAEKQSVLSLRSVLMAVFDLTNTHRSRLWRDDEVSNSNGYKLRRV